MDDFEKKKDIYVPIIEDISMDDDTLCSAVKAIEQE